MQKLFQEIIANSWGEWTLLWDEQGIVHFDLGKRDADKPVESKPLPKFAATLARYLQGKPVEWKWQLHLQGTPFQRKVWDALRQIPYGQTRSYQEIAASCDSPRAARAVGHACGANPIMLIIPCHRVVGKDGSLTGFGSGIAVKEKLLALERHN